MRGSCACRCEDHPRAVVEALVLVRIRRRGPPQTADFERRAQCPEEEWNRGILPVSLWGVGKIFYLFGGIKIDWSTRAL